MVFQTRIFRHRLFYTCAGWLAISLFLIGSAIVGGTQTIPEAIRTIGIFTLILGVLVVFGGRWGLLFTLANIGISAITIIYTLSMVNPLILLPVILCFLGSIAAWVGFILPHSLSLSALIGLNAAVSVSAGTLIYVSLWATTGQYSPLIAIGAAGLTGTLCYLLGLVAPWIPSFASFPTPIRLAGTTTRAYYRHGQTSVVQEPYQSHSAITLWLDTDTVPLIETHPIRGERYTFKGKRADRWLRRLVRWALRGNPDQTVVIRHRGPHSAVATLRWPWRDTTTSVHFLPLDQPLP